MQCLPLDGKLAPHPAVPVRAIFGIPHYRMADIGHVDAYLMGAACFQPALRQGIFPKAFQHPEMGNSRLAIFPDNGHLFTVRGIPADIPTDDAGFFLDVAPDHRLIDAESSLFLNLLCQAEVCLVILGCHHDAGGILVQPVDDARADFPVDAGQILTMMHQGIDQSAGKHSCCRVHHHASCLIDDDYILVLIKNVQRNILRENFRIFRLRHGQFHRIASFQLVVSLAHRLIYGGIAAGNQLLHMGTGKLRLHSGQEYIQPLACLISCKYHLHSAFAKYQKSKYLPRRRWQYQQY